LYGPPGCGKTFIARKLAEIIGFHFLDTAPSDLGSIYVRGGQLLIRQIFEQARKKAPTIIFFDEFDALVPRWVGRGKSSPQVAVRLSESQVGRAASPPPFRCGAERAPCEHSFGQASGGLSAHTTAHRLHSTKVGIASWSAKRKSMLQRSLPVEGSGTGISRLIKSHLRGSSGSIWSPGKRSKLRSSSPLKFAILVLAADAFHQF
jgi:ATPase family associated with various cellular activities (AAA)